MKIPSSHLVRSRIVGLPFTKESRKYIQALETLAALVNRPPSSLAEGLTKNELAARYPHELRALTLERSARDLGPDADLDLDTWRALGGEDAE